MPFITVVTDSYLFPKEHDFSPNREFGRVEANRTVGAYHSHKHLLETHLNLMKEDFLRSLNRQVNDIRKDPAILDTRACYDVTGGRVLSKRRGRRTHEEGIEMRFDESKYRDVNWVEEKRFLHGNLVFLTQNGMQDFVIGIIHNRSVRSLLKGIVVIKLCR